MWGHCVPDGCGLGLGKLGWVMAYLAVAHKLAPPVCWAPTAPWPLGHSSWACALAGGLLLWSGELPVSQGWVRHCGHQGRGRL